MMSWIYLFIAIAAEIVATSMLKASQEFTRLVPSVIVVVGYCVAFYFLSLTLRTIPVGVAYAVWSGVGIVIVALIGWIAYQQKLDLPAILGIGLIVTGVLVMNLFSKTVGH
nr:multidrug efflux SMR transporter [Pasteurella testudinis]